jgi:hypothetical protein
MHTAGSQCMSSAGGPRSLHGAEVRGTAHICRPSRNLRASNAHGQQHLLLSVHCCGSQASSSVGLLVAGSCTWSSKPARQWGQHQRSGLSCDATGHPVSHTGRCTRIRCTRPIGWVGPCRGWLGKLGLSFQGGHAHFLGSQRRGSATSSVLS